MPEPLAVVLPLLNANEPESFLAKVHVLEGQSVRAGDVLATLETTKSSGEVTAEHDGYVVGLRLEQGQMARAGEVLCYLAETPTNPSPVQSAAPAVKPEPAEPEVPEGLRITRPALALAREHGLDLHQLPHGPLVVEAQVRELLKQQPAAARETPRAVPAMAAQPDISALIVYGGGGHGKSLIDLVRLLGTYRLVGVIDDGQPAGGNVLGVPVVGGSDSLSKLYQRGIFQAVNAVGGIGNLSVRQKVFERLAEAGFVCPAVVHPTAFVEASAQLAAGVQVFPHAYVGSSAQVGFGTIVNTSVVVSHDCRLGDCANISPGALLAGGVEVGDQTLIGMGVTVFLGVKIGAGVRIGNGATIKADVPAGTVVQAGMSWPA